MEDISQLKVYLEIIRGVVERKIKGENVNKNEFNKAVRNFDNVFKKIYLKINTHEIDSDKFLFDNAKNSFIMAWQQMEEFLKGNKEFFRVQANKSYNFALMYMKKIK